MLHVLDHEQIISGEEMHYIMASIMASDIVSGLKWNGILSQDGIPKWNFGIFA